MWRKKGIAENAWWWEAVVGFLTMTTSRARDYERKSGY
jgi:hypothetical protein